jgi:membrane dipeptidase
VADLLPLLEEREEAYFANPRAEAAAQARLLAEHPLPPVPLARFVDHLIHLLDQAGEEHVGIGSDFDGIPETLVGFEDPSCFPALAAALLARGVDRAGLRLILGGNFLRLLRTAERFAD